MNVLKKMTIQGYMCVHVSVKDTVCAKCLRINYYDHALKLQRDLFKRE